MFSNKIKDFFIKRNVKKKLSNVKHVASDKIIKTVGVIFDEAYFIYKDELFKSIKKYGIDESKIQFIVFKNKIKKSDVYNYTVYNQKDISWNCEFTNPNVTEFITKNFDLLISYYDFEKAGLLLLSHLSNASFKVGFSSVDKRLHPFMIDTNAENHKVFAQELFKYLKILNKI